MAKNALQAQLLKAGLVDAKQLKKADKQQHHAKRTGQDDSQRLRNDIEQARLDKLARDQALDQAKQQQLDEKTRKANIVQMIQQHRIANSQGDIGYQFIDTIDQKIKKVYVSQSLYNGLVSGSVLVAREQFETPGQYAFLPKALADRINQRMTGFVIQSQQQEDDQRTAEDDPYAAYVIPDDLMW